jgi:hypothetical protein
MNRVGYTPAPVSEKFLAYYFLSFFLSFLLILTSFYIVFVGIQKSCCTWSRLIPNTLCRTPLDEWSAHRRDLFLSTLPRGRHPLPRRNTNPKSQQASGHRLTPYTTRPLEPAHCFICNYSKKGSILFIFNDESTGSCICFRLDLHMSHVKVTCATADCFCFLCSLPLTTRSHTCA